MYNRAHKQGRNHRTQPYAGNRRREEIRHDASYQHQRHVESQFHETKGMLQPLGYHLHKKLAGRHGHIHLHLEGNTHGQHTTANKQINNLLHKIDGGYPKQHVHTPVDKDTETERNGYLQQVGTQIFLERLVRHERQLKQHKQDFDSLPGSQLLYSQLAEFIQVDHLPIVSLKPEKSRYLRQTFDLFSSDLRGFKIYTHGIIDHLCCLLLLQTADTFCQSNRHMPVYVKRSGEIFRKFRKLLTAHYRQHHDIGFYADELHISTTYLSRIVKQTTGNTVRFLISELLCADARRMLVCTDLDIKEIASQLGFSDQSVFGKFFVKKTGLSPLKFRLRKEL